MSSRQPTRTLVVANLTASTPALLEEIARRGRARPSEFTLLIPPVDEHKHPDWTPDVALRLLKRAAPHARVNHLAAQPDALAAIRRTVEEGNVDEIVVSTVPTYLAELLRHDLPHRLKTLGLPVILIPPEVDRPDAEGVRDLLENLAAAHTPGFGGY